MLDALDIEYIVENDWICLKCIFHDGEKHNLRYRNKFFYCFSECQKSYTIIDIVKKSQNIDFGEAIRLICSILGITNDYKKVEHSLELRANLQRMKRMKNLNKDSIILDSVDNSVWKDIECPILHKYMRERGFTKETADYFSIGFATDGFLDGRITIPIDSVGGEIVSIVGRLPYNDCLSGERKYINLKGVKLNQTVYNISRAIESIKATKRVFVVEGYMSVFRLHQWGYDNAVALMGASISDAQVKILLKLGVEIVVIGDNDPAGKRLNQAVINRCSKISKTTALDISKVTNMEKAAVDDISKEDFEKLLGGTI